MRPEGRPARPERMQLSRKRGFDLQAASRALNGLPAMSVARPTLFGNPFVIDETTSHQRAVNMFRQLLVGERYIERERNPLIRLADTVTRNTVRANLHRLRGHNLACWCAAGCPCHVDVYLELLETTSWPDLWKVQYHELVKS